MSRPTKPYTEVKAMLGNASPAWEKLVGQIRRLYEIDEIWTEGNPTHKHYNILTFKRGGKSLITLCLREGFFIVSITLGAKERDKFELERAEYSAEVLKQYDETAILHDGLWLGWEVRDEKLIDDFIRFCKIKRKPNRKVTPSNIEKCGQLDIGLTGDEITSIIS